MSEPDATDATQESHHPEPQAGSSITSWSGASPAWKQFVRWDGRIRPINDVVYDQLPEVKKLRELNKKSLTVPAWLADIDSPEWAAYYKYTRRLQAHTEALANAVSCGPYTLEEKDEDLSFDLHESLPFILHIPRHTAALYSHFPIKPTEADRRHPMDTLGSLIWDLQSDEHIVYRMKRKLAIPCLPEREKQERQEKPAKPEHTGEVQPDACAFIHIPGVVVASRSIITALSCLSTGMDPDYALHWVTEYDEPAPKRQVVEGLVSALYQRRALGFPNHFVFGTAHYSETTLEVLAATWVRSDEARPEANKHQERSVPGDQHRDTTGNLSRGDNMAGSEPQTNENTKIESAVPPKNQANDPPINSLQGDDTKSGTPNDANTTPDIKDIKNYNKIVVYSMAKYDMMFLEDIMQLYLLMRQTLGLAQRYRAEIMKDGSRRVRQLSKDAEELYQWPPPPRPKSNRGTKRRRTSSSEYSSSCSSTSEDDNMDACEGSDYESDPEELESLSDAGPMRRVVGEG